MLVADNLVKTFPEFTLGPISIEFAPGRSYGLLGPNGAGKTTFLDLLAVQLRPTGGQLRYGGAPIAWADTLWKERLGFVRESPAFYAELTVAQTLRLASRLYRRWEQPLAELLLDRLRLDGRKPVGTLSKGTLVKLGLVVALAHEAEVLILDEPTAGLDPTARRELLESVAALRHDRPALCLLIASHIFEDVEELADEIVILKEGRITVRQDRSQIVDLAAVYHSAAS
jgi:ABC-2 type transport system ATP-binding protein